MKLFGKALILALTFSIADISAAISQTNSNILSRIVKFKAQKESRVQDLLLGRTNDVGAYY